LLPPIADISAPQAVPDIVRRRLNGSFLGADIAAYYKHIRGGKANEIIQGATRIRGRACTNRRRCACSGGMTSWVAVAGPGVDNHKRRV